MAYFVNTVVFSSVGNHSQGSRDNMSIVIIAFDQAPKVSEEAKRKEAELDSRLEKKVKGLCRTVHASSCLT